MERLYNCVKMKEYLYIVKLKRKNWTPEIGIWLRQSVGSENWRRGDHKGTMYDSRDYRFVREDDAIAFKLRFI